MGAYTLLIHPNAPDAADQITWDFDFRVEFIEEFLYRFPKQGLTPYDWDSVLDSRYSVFAVMIGGRFEPRATVVSDAQSGVSYMLGLVWGASQKQLRDAACNLSCTVLGLSQPDRVDNPA